MDKTSKFALWNGTEWLAPDTKVLNAYFGNDADVHSLRANANGTLVYIGGNFNCIGGGANCSGGTIARHLAQWDGAALTPLPNSPGVRRGLYNTTVNAMLCVSPTNLTVGGDFRFTCPYVTGAKNIAAWNGSSWQAFKYGTGDSFLDGSVLDLASDGSNIYAAGYFLEVNNGPTFLDEVRVHNIGRWDGSKWHAMGSGLWDVGFAGPAHAVTVHQGTVYAGGRFASGGEALGILFHPLNHIAYYNNGWHQVGSGLGHTILGALDAVLTLESYTDTNGPRLYAGGQFINTSNINNLAYWNGTSWNTVGGGVAYTKFPLVNLTAVNDMLITSSLTVSP